jgi:hypothetical protein
MKKISLALILALIAIGISSVAFAVPGGAGGWMILGTAHVNGKSDHDKIKCSDTGTYRAIQLRITGSAVQFDKVLVRYGNGQSEEIA